MGIISCILMRFVWLGTKVTSKRNQRVHNKNSRWEVLWWTVLCSPKSGRNPKSQRIYTPSLRWCFQGKDQYKFSPEITTFVLACSVLAINSVNLMKSGIFTLTAISALTWLNLEPNGTNQNLHQTTISVTNVSSKIINKLFLRFQTKSMRISDMSMWHAINVKLNQSGAFGSSARPVRILTFAKVIFWLKTDCYDKNLTIE